MSGTWLPLHENHAISVMGLSIAFGEQIPALLFRKALVVIERKATELGLLHKQPIMGAQVSFNANGFNSTEQLTPGALFSSFAEHDGSNGLPPQPSEQIQIDPARVVIRCWNYVSWTWQKARMLEAIEGFANSIAGVVSVANVRLEYQDRFFFDGPIVDAAPDRLLNAGSRYISPHVFSEDGMWHSHTGHFLKSKDPSQGLLQINIDARDEAIGPSLQRWITITTARENRYSTAIDEAVPMTLGLIANAIENQHSDLISALEELITSSTANKIYLKG